VTAPRITPATWVEMVARADRAGVVLMSHENAEGVRIFVRFAGNASSVEITSIEQLEDVLVGSTVTS
jgi:hypothetical protein